MSKKDIPTIHQSSTFNHCSCPASTFVTHCGALSLSAVGPYTRNYLPVQRLCRVYKSLVKLSQTLHIHTNLSPSTTYTVAGALRHTQRIVGTFHQPKPPRPWLHGSWLSSTSPGNQAPTRRCPVPLDILLPRSHTCISEALPTFQPHHVPWLSTTFTSCSRYLHLLQPCCDCSPTQSNQDQVPSTPTQVLRPTKTTLSIKVVLVTVV
jgi:hypothetical protein